MQQVATEIERFVALAPSGVVDYVLQLAVPVFAAGFGLVLLLWFVGGAFEVALSVFDVD